MTGSWARCSNGRWPKRATTRAWPPFCWVMKWRQPSSSSAGNHRRLRELIARVAAELEIPVAQARELVGANVQEAVKIAGRFGVPAVEAYLLEEEVPVVDQEPATAHGANAQVQLEALQEIGSYLDSDPDLDELVRLVLGGIHRGVGFDRAFFGLLTPDRLQLVVRHALGGDYRGTIAMPADGKPNLLQAVLRSGKALWVSDENRRGHGAPAVGWPRLLGVQHPVRHDARHRQRAGCGPALRGQRAQRPARRRCSLRRLPALRPADLAGPREDSWGRIRRISPAVATGRSDRLIRLRVPTCCFAVIGLTRGTGTRRRGEYSCQRQQLPGARPQRAAPE